MHYDVRSLNRNFDSIDEFISLLSVQFSVYGFSETWLNDTNDVLIHKNSYRFINANRSKGKGGGVAFLVHDSLSFKIRYDIAEENDIYENLFIEIDRPGKKNIIIGIVYRKPSSNINDFTVSISNILHEILHENKLVYLMGDININLCHSSSKPVNEFLNMMSSFSLFPVIDKPTRITNNTSSVIDNIFTNDISSHIIPGVIYSDITDHFPIFSYVI